MKKGRKMSLRLLRIIRNTGAWIVLWGILFYLFWTSHDGWELVNSVFGFVLFSVMNEIIYLRKLNG